MMRANGMNRMVGGTNEIGQKDRNAERLPPGAGHARERIAGGHSQHQRDRDDGEADEAGIDEPLHELGVLEQHPQIVERRRIVI